LHTKADSTTETTELHRGSTTNVSQEHFDNHCDLLTELSRRVGGKKERNGSSTRIAEGFHKALIPNRPWQ